MTTIRMNRATLCLALFLGACAGQDAHEEGDESQRAAPATGTTRRDNSRERFDAPPLPESDLTGKDDNGDHIRDDVEAYVDETFGDDELKRLSARQLARSFQHMLVAAEYEEAALAATDEFMQGWACMNKAGHDTAKVMAELRARTLDTMGRSEAYLAYNRRISGAYLKSPPESFDRCAFDVMGLVP